MRTDAALLAVFAFALFALSGPGHSSFRDGFLIFQTARGLLDDGDPSVPPPTPDEHLVKVHGADGRWYAKFAPGLVVAHLPTLALARRLPFTPEIDGAPAEPFRADEFRAQLTNAWIGAATVTLVFLTAMRLGASTAAGVGAALLVALGSPFWLYTRIDSTETLQALSLAGIVHALAGPPRRWARAGAWSGALVLAKLANLVVVPWLVVLALTSRRASALVRLVVPVVIALVLFGFWNHLRFGNVFATGYDLGSESFDTPLFEGLGVLLTSPSFGLVAFWPAFLLVLAGAPAFVRRHPFEGTLVAGVFLILAIVYAQWWAPSGVHWGPRFLIPAVPVLALFALPLLDAGRWSRGAVMAAAALGMIVQTIPVAFGFWTHVAPVWRHVVHREASVLFVDPRLAPLRIGAWWAHTSVLDWIGAGQASGALLVEPPWTTAYPWKDTARAVADLGGLRGVDLWAAPDAVRLDGIYTPGSNERPGIPGSRPFAAVLAVVLATTGIGLFRRARHRPASLPAERGPPFRPRDG